MTEDFLPVSQADLQARGWHQLDFLLINGDAYVDHPSFGAAVISRILQRHGYKVGIIAQPDWRSLDEFRKLGKPRLGVLVTAGNMDSMLNKYTAAKKLRSNDSYSPGGRSGLRPERATLVYCSRIREMWEKTPLIIGGIEASLRRFAHYDYWSDTVRRSILVDSKADLLIFGMGERQIIEIADKLASGINISQIKDVRGTCYLDNCLEASADNIEVPGFLEVKENKQKFAESFKIGYLEQDPFRGKVILQKHDAVYLVQNPPAKPLTSKELDEVYDLPYTRMFHPVYEKSGGIPAIQEVRFSITAHRGCFGGCAFCAINLHQGRIIQARSHESIIKEAWALTKLPDFKGYIHDVGGPTANFHIPACSKQAGSGMCKDHNCLSPAVCKNLTVDHSDYLKLLRTLRALPKVKKVFIRSGIRYDYLLLENSEKLLKEICEHHVSGQLKIAPEHVSPKVTKLMGKSGKNTYIKFMDEFKKVNKLIGKEQYLVPYFMSSHPGAGLAEAIELAEFIRDLKYQPEQVQDFIPTPGTLSTCMYYSGVNPLTGEKVFTAKTAEDKQIQRALIQYKDPKNFKAVLAVLNKAGRQDLIGWGPKCLISLPKSFQQKASNNIKKKRKLSPSQKKK